MINSKQIDKDPPGKDELWVHSLARYESRTQPSPETRVRTMISCDVRKGKASIFVPPDMSELQPRSLRYLHTFAEKHNLQLVEDRRRIAVRPINEKRNRTASVIAKGLSELLTQLGMPGEIRSPSRPHRLAADSPHIPINKLIRMAAFSTTQAKCVDIQPNRKLLDVLNGNSALIKAYGCKLITENASTVLSYFDSPGFRSIGYSAGKQYVMHVCLAGGPVMKPAMWADFHTLTRTDFQLQLFQAQDAKHDLGLFYSTFYIDLSGTPAPWWQHVWADKQMPLSDQDWPALLQRAS